VLLASSGRTDALVAAMTAAEMELCDAGVKVPRRYTAFVQAVQNLSPQLLNDEERLQDWLDILELSAVDLPTIRNQLGLQLISNRLPEYRRISSPCLVVGFADDLVIRPYLCREVAQSIPGAVYQEIAGCGHYGCLEKPAAVNEAIISFFAGLPIETADSP
jgi:pimeloyl-ACP methyl ester carboxylesterase